MRDTIDVYSAMCLWAKHGTWSRVARIMKRKDGSRYQAPSIASAVSRYVSKWGKKK